MSKFNLKGELPARLVPDLIDLLRGFVAGNPGQEVEFNVLVELPNLSVGEYVVDLGTTDRQWPLD
jgi:hypothetical protein